jgi:hypothetical protein
VTDPREELAEVEAELRALTERRDRLRALVHGPRVDPVVVLWARGTRHEEDYFDGLVDAARFARFDHDDLYVECVKIGGYTLTEDEVDALAEEATRG